MAVRFSADDQDYTATLSLGSQAAMSACCWMKMTVSRTWSTAICLDGGTSTALILQTGGTSTNLGLYEDPTAAFKGTQRTITVGTWYWAGFSISGTTGTFYTRAHGDAAVTTTALTGITATHTITTVRLGESVWGGEWLNGAVQAVKVWNAALTQAELEAETWRNRPARTTNLIAWYPLTRPETADYSGNARTLTATGSGAVQEDGPGITWGPGRPRRVKKTTSTTVGVTPAAETDAAQTLGRRKTRAAGTAAGTETAQTLARRKTRTLTATTATDAARPLVATKTITLGTATSPAEARPLSVRKTYSLGTATVTETVQPAGRPIVELVDGFDGGTLSGLWPNSFGAYGIASGRGSVTCDTGYNALSSARTWRLAESQVSVRVYPAAAATAGAQVLVLSGTTGTDIGFEINSDVGVLAMFSRVGWADAEAVYLGYSSTEHAWLRLREAAGALHWETSPDGTGWTVQRTATSPIWVNAPTLEFQLITHRDTGTPDVAEFDQVNVPPAITSLHLDTAEEAGAARSLTARKTVMLGTAVGAEVAQPVVAAKLHVIQAAAEIGTALALTAGKALGVGVVGGRDSALPVGRHKTVGVDEALETATTRQVHATKTHTVEAAGAEDGARPVAVGKTVALESATGHDTAQNIATGKSATLQPAGETDSSRTPGHSKTAAIDPAGHVDTTRALTAAKTATLAQAQQADGAQPVTATRHYPLGPAVEHEAAQAVDVGKQYTLEPAGGVDEGRELGLAGGIAAATETNGARPLGVHRSYLLGTATAVETGSELRPVRRIGLGAAGSTETARPLAIVKRFGIGAAGEQDAAATVGTVYEVPVAQAVAVESAQPLTAAKQYTLGTAEEAADAQPLATAGGIRAADTVETAQPLAVTKRLTLGTAAETGAAQSVHTGMVRVLGVAAVIAQPRALTVAKRYALVGAEEVDGAESFTGTVGGGGYEVSEPMSRWKVAAHTERSQPLGLADGWSTTPAEDQNPGMPAGRWEVDEPFSSQEHPPSS